MSFYGASLYEPDVEYSEVPQTLELRQLAPEQIEWRPSSWLTRAAATLSLCAALGSPMSTSSPVVVIGGSSGMAGRASPVNDRGSVTPIDEITSRMQARAGLVSRMFRRTPHPGATDVDPDYGF